MAVSEVQYQFFRVAFRGAKGDSEEQNSFGGNDESEGVNFDDYFRSPHLFFRVAFRGAKGDSEELAVNF